MAREILLATGFEAGVTGFYEAQGWELISGTSGSGVVATPNRHITRLGAGGAYAWVKVGTTFGVVCPRVDSASARWMHCWMMAEHVTVSNLYDTVIQFQLAGAAQMALRISRVTGEITIRRGGPDGTVLATSPVGTFNYSTGYWIAVYLHADNTGTMRVFVNGKEVVSYTGDTQALASGGWDRVAWTRYSSGLAVIYLDDVIITDDDGGMVLTPLPEAYGQPLVPTEVVSGNLTGVPTTGTGRYANVANLPWDPSQYNEAAAPGDEDLYQMGGFVDMGGDILAVAVCANAYRQGLITQAELQVVSGGVGSYGAPEALAATPGTTTWCRHFSEDPAGGAWTPASVNALQAGVRFS